MFRPRKLRNVYFLLIRDLFPPDTPADRRKCYLVLTIEYYITFNEKNQPYQRQNRNFRKKQRSVSDISGGAETFSSIKGLQSEVFLRIKMISAERERFVHKSEPGFCVCKDKGKNFRSRKKGRHFSEEQMNGSDVSGRAGVSSRIKMFPTEREHFRA